MTHFWSPSTPMSPRHTHLRNRIFFATVLAAIVVGLWLTR